MTLTITPPEPLREDKPDFALLPASMRLRLADMLGAPIAHGCVAYGGYSASASFLLTLEDGRCFFAKGNHPDERSHGTQTLRQEIFIYTHVPLLAELAPRYRGMVSDGDEDGWMLGVWDFVPHTPPPPAARTAKAADALARWHHAPPATQGLARLTPHTQQNYIASFFRDEKKWHRLVSGEPPRDKFLTLFQNQEEGQAWLDAHLATLLRWQGCLPHLAPRCGLLHGDLRYDNILFQPERAYIIDWPNACHGPLSFDLLTLLADGSETNAPHNSATLLDDYTACGGVQPPQDEMITLAAALAGYFADQAYRLPPLKMPRLRTLQKRILRGLLAELSRRGVVAPIPDFS